LCVDLRDILMALLNCLRVPRQFQRFRRRGEESEGDYLLKLIFLGLLVFAGFRCLAVELFRRELFPYLSAVLKSAEMCSHRRRTERKGNESPRCPRDKDGHTFKLKSAFSSPDMMDVVCEACVSSYSAIRVRYVRLLSLGCDVEG
jgi:hypothetical protein